MSFWNTSEGEALNQNNSGNAEMGGGDLAPIPANTLLRAIVTEAKWDEAGGDQIIKLRWDVVDGEYKNRVIFHKLKVCDPDAKKQDKAKRMLAAIAHNAGGKLLECAEINDASLQMHLTNKPMLIKVQVWKIPADQTDDGQERSGNWVSAVESGKASSAPQQPADKSSGDIGF